MDEQREKSKKLLEKQQRRLAEQRRLDEQQRAARRRNLVTFAIALVVVVVVVALVARDRTSGPGGNVGVAAAEANCTDVERPQLQDAAHIEQGTEHPPYSSSPPASGPHYDTPAQTGFYPEPLAPEQVVHNLEHGQIVIWYRPGAPQAVVDDVQALVGQQRLATVAVPYEDIEPPYQVALTAWGALQMCEEVAQAVVDDFRERFQGRGPEQVGVPTFDKE